MVRVAVVEKVIEIHQSSMNKFDITCINLATSIGKLETAQAVMNENMKEFRKDMTENKEEMTQASNRSIRNLGIAMTTILSIVEIVLVVLMKVIF